MIKTVARVKALGRYPADAGWRAGRERGRRVVAARGTSPGGSVGPYGLAPSSARATHTMAAGSAALRLRHRTILTPGRVSPLCEFGAQKGTMVASGAAKSLAGETSSIVSNEAMYGRIGAVITLVTADIGLPVALQLVPPSEPRSEALKTPDGHRPGRSPTGCQLTKHAPGPGVPALPAHHMRRPDTDD